MLFINHTGIGETSAAIIEADGPLNSDSAPDFDDYISKLMDNDIIFLLLDMQNLTFMSSEGIGAALILQKKVNEKNGLAVFFNLNYEITSLFKLLGFDSVFTIASDRAEALNILDRHMELFPPELQHQTSDKKTDTEEIFEETLPDFPEPDKSEPEDSGDIEIVDHIFEPFIIECIKCRSLIRIKEQGEQLCPYCSADFTVTDEKKAVFKIKEIHSVN